MTNVIIRHCERTGIPELSRLTDKLQLLGIQGYVFEAGSATASDSFILTTKQARSTGDGRWPSRPVERACGLAITVPECTSP
jgi:hypothetical protein